MRAYAVSQSSQRRFRTESDNEGGEERRGEERRGDLLVYTPSNPRRRPGHLEGNLQS